MPLFFNKLGQARLFIPLPERQRQHGDNEKPRLARQDTKGKANVLRNHIRYTTQDGVRLGGACFSLPAVLELAACVIWIYAFPLRSASHKRDAASTDRP